MGRIIFTYKIHIACAVVLNIVGFVFCFHMALAAQSLPSAIVKLPADENAIVVEKKTQTLFVYKKNEGRLVPLFQASCSTGEVGGIKQKAGDKKTPEGVYFLKDEYEDRYLSPVYGQKAFPTDYPNLIDKRDGKNGSAIWIHGTNKKLEPMDSNGCVALENQNIVKLSEFVNLDSTPVIMLEKIQMSEESEILKQEDEISQMLTRWSAAAETGSYHEYLAFYAPEYLPDISWWESWTALRKQAGNDDSSLRLHREQTGIYLQDSTFVALFDSFMSSGDKKIYLGKKKLFLKKQGAGYKIVGDVFQTVPAEFAPGAHPLVAGGKSIVTRKWHENDLIEYLEKWLAAWSAEDMTAYASFYSDGFFSDGMNKKQWVGRKRALAQKYDFIHVTGRDFKVTKNQDRCEVVFFQEYKSSGLTTEGTKRLKLVNKGGLWTIYQESWKEK